MASHSDYCAQLVREADRDRYLATLFAPGDRRAALFALYAFDIEIGRVRDVAREPMPGEIRLQWWRDLLEGGGQGDSLANPLAAGLMQAIAAYRLPRAPLVAMTEARIFDLYDDPMESTAMFEGYAGETASALIQLTAMVLDPENAQKAADAAGHAGIAQLAAGCLLLLPTHRSRRQLYVPRDILAATGLDSATFLKGEDKTKVAAALSAFIGFGRDHLKKARAAAPAAGRGVSPAFLPVAFAEIVFDRAEKVGAGALTQSLQPSQLSRQWRLWRASRKHLF